MVVGAVAARLGVEEEPGRVRPMLSPTVADGAAGPWTRMDMRSLFAANAAECSAVTPRGVATFGSAPSCSNRLARWGLA